MFLIFIIVNLSLVPGATCQAIQKNSMSVLKPKGKYTITHCNKTKGYPLIQHRSDTFCGKIAIPIIKILNFLISDIQQAVVVRATRFTSIEHNRRNSAKSAASLVRGGEMPYKAIVDLPDSVRDNLPVHAQEIYKEAFNSAYEQYKERGPEGREETAHKVAWSTVKKKYRKNDRNGKWELDD